MNIAANVNTVLDLSGYDAASGLDLCVLPGGILSISGVILFFFGVISCVKKSKEIIEAGIYGMVVGVVLLAVAVIPSSSNDHAFSDYVNASYGFETSSVPGVKPKDGSLPVTWEKGGEIHSGTLNLLDNKVSIKETDGGYLEVMEQASLKNGE